MQILAVDVGDQRRYGRMAPVARVLPKSETEVRLVVDVARSYCVPLYAISKGNNWGYGSDAPSCENCVILDLKYMDRILEMDSVLGTVTVEPGVTFDQLSNFLHSQHSKWFANVTGAPGRTSVLGNALERGVGIGRYGDRFSSVLDMRILLSTGELFCLGASRYGKGMPIGRKEVCGPDLTGLFAQSNFGIVLSITLKLQLVSKHCWESTISFDGKRLLRRTIDSLRALWQQGAVDAQIVLWNDFRQFARLLDYPWQFVRRGRIGPRLRNELRQLCGVREWTLRVVSYAPDKDLLRAKEAHIRKTLEISGVNFVSRVIRENGRGTVYAGVPDADSLESIYWRVPAARSRSGNPDADGAGAVWGEFACPMRGDVVARAVAHGSDVLRAHGFEPLVMIVGVWDRSLTVVFLLLFDAFDAGACTAAKDCHRALVEVMRSLGCLVARVPSDAMDALPMVVDDSSSVMARLKDVLDPCGIISPGRYPVHGHGSIANSGSFD